MPDIEGRIGYRFASRELLDEALRHGSVGSAEGRGASYQRLEFLGDSVLNLCVSGELFARFPEAEEGELTRRKFAVISNRNLVRVGLRLGLREDLTTDRSLRRSGGGVTDKMVADVVEAIAAAVFLDGGFEEARAFVHRLFFEVPEGSDAAYERFDDKSRLQEWCQKAKKALPVYTLIEEAGPGHSRVFTVSVRIDDRLTAVGAGRTKKDAEMEAAGRLLVRIAQAERPS